MKNNLYGNFFIVATPIGNLDDITLRALETLKNVDFILCEDTRESQKLLNHYKINNKKLIAYHKFNETKSIDKILNLLFLGNNIALISDAGMPLISDPGSKIIQKINEFNQEQENLNQQKIKISICPGASSLTSALALSGFDEPFTFFGFLNLTKNQLKTFYKNLSNGLFVFFIAPHKLIFNLEVIDEIFKEKAIIFLAKEISKKYEQTFLNHANELISYFNQNPPKGEFTMILKISKQPRTKINKYPKDKFN